MNLTSGQLKFFVFLILFSPGIGLLGRTIYPFEIAALVYLSLSLLVNKTITKHSGIVLLYIFVVLLILIVQGFYYGQLMALDLIRILPAFLILFVVRTKDVEFQEMINFIVAICCCVALIGVVQTIDGLLLSNITGVSSILSSLYPYAGELTGSAAAKAGDYQLKISSAWSSTSTFDGHPILLADFLVLATVLVCYFKRNFALVIIMFALVTTFTRGAWVAAVAALLFRYLFMRRQVSWSEIFKFLAVVGAIGLVIYSVEPLRDYVEFRILNTLASFDLISGYDRGRIGDPRTETVWPAFFELLSQSGIVAYLFGVPTNHSTDSGYLTYIQNSGVTGALMVGALFLYFYRNMALDKGFVKLLFFTLSILFIVHPVFQGYRSVYFLGVLLLIFRKDEINHGR
ncbi:hypothetical protein N9R10_03035 [Pseudomonadales bacterium]|nr:hypothetical protein [Pseudomonadales bacterium]